MKSGGILHHTATMYGLTIEKHKRKFIIFIIYFLFHGSVYGQDNSYLIFNHSVSSDTVQLKDRCFENKARTLSEMDYRITEERTGNCRPDSFDDIRTQIEKTDAGSLDPRFVQTQIVGVTTIFLGQHYGGTKFLSRLWYTGAFMLPYFIPTDAQHNLKQNFLAITPALLTLGLFNNYLANDRADNSRIFIGNLIGFNLALWWKSKILTSSKSFGRSYSNTRMANENHKLVLQELVFTPKKKGIGIGFTW